jgi:hypothetical protein
MRLGSTASKVQKLEKGADGRRRGSQWRRAKGPVQAASAVNGFLIPDPGCEQLRGSHFPAC